MLDLDGGQADGIIGDRSFSEDPATAAAYGLAYSQGLAAAGVVPTAKHFPGHGTTSQDTHDTLPTVAVTLDELRAHDLEPFAALVDAGVPVVMVNHVVYSALDPQLPASLSPRAYQLLRDMGFRGMAITDSLGMGAINPRWPYPEAAVRALAAGADAVLASEGEQASGMRNAVVAAVRTGRLPEARLNEAAARVTALAGGDPYRFACQRVQLPSLTQPR